MSTSTTRILNAVHRDKGGAAFNIAHKDFGASSSATATANTNALNAALSAAILVKGTVFVPPGTYDINDALNLTGANGLAIVFAKGATLHQTVSTKRVFTGSATNVYFERPTLTGPFTIGIALSSATGIAIVDPDISGGTVRETSGLLHCGGILLTQAQDIHIVRGKLYGNGNVVTAGSDVKGSDLQIGEDGLLSYRVKIDGLSATSTAVKSNVALFDTDDWACDKLTASGAKTIGTSGGYGFVAYESGASGNNKNGRITNSRVKDCQGSGIYLQTLIGGSASNNDVENCGTLMTESVLVVGNIALSNCTRVTVNGGQLKSAGRHGLVIVHVDTTTGGCKATGVSIDGAVERGVCFKGTCVGTTVEACTVKNTTGDGYGNPDLGGSTPAMSHIELIGNHAESIGGAAYALYNASNSQIAHNTLKTANKQAVAMGSGGTLNRIGPNNFSGANASTGFDDILCTTTNTDVEGNTCSATGTITLTGAGTRQRNNRAATITLSGGAASQVTGDTSGLMVLTDAAGTDFKRLQLGGTTASFPAIRRTTTSMDAVLADNSAYTRWNARHFSTQGGSFLGSLATITYSASMTPDASLGNLQVITATNNTAFAINTPTNPSTGQRLRIKIKNTSGGALGAATFSAAFKLGAAWVQPANGFSRTIEFDNDGTNWIETFRSAADVAN